MVDFSVLGPVKVTRDGVALPTGSGRERFVLASLLLNADRLTSADVLVDALWSDPPRSAKAQLHNMISNLRRRLGGGQDGLIASRPLGYELRLGPHRLDLLEFRRLVTGGRQAAADGELSLAVAMFAEALSLWRGPAMADVGDELAAGVRQALHEERLAAAESKLDADLALGRFDELLSDLAALVTEHPYRERLWQTRMLALAGAGRRAEALDTYRQMRHRFVDELGVEPGPALRQLEQRILRGEGTVRSAIPLLPRQLPPATAAITGRDKLIGEILAELSRSDPPVGPVIVLAGPGGVGKTSLALTVAHEVRASFPDGQLYADLRGSRDDPVDPHNVAGRFLRALGVEGPSLPDDPQERVAMYRSRLATSRTLVVLDDAASEDQVRSLLPGDEGCAALVTSRRRLAALVTPARWTIPVLDAPDAAELLARIVGLRRVTAEPDAVTAIVDLCGCLPLAVCVAAARLAVHPDWTLTEFQSMLAVERQRLDELAVGDLDVRASIALSYRLLSPDLQRLFRRLGLVAAADWPSWVASELINGVPVDRLLDQLVDVHLIEPLGSDPVGQRRFRLHDLVSDFARERVLDEEPEHEHTAALTRVLSGWLALAGEADERAEHGMMPATGLPSFPPPQHALMRPIHQTPRKWLDAERASLTTAVDQACQAGLAGIAGALALRLSGFLALRNYDDDWELTLRTATGCVRAHGQNDDVLIRLMSALFAVSLRRSRNAELPDIAAEELALACRLGDRWAQVSALANAGWAARKRGRLAEAAGWLEQALATCDADTPTRLRTRAMHGLALVHREAGRPEPALPLAEQALAIERPQGRARITAICLINYAGALFDAGQLAAAEVALAEAREVSGHATDDLRATDIELTHAEIDVRRGRWQAAMSRLDRALALAEAHANHSGTAEVLRVIADVAIGQGKPRKAIEPLRRALAIWRRLDVPLEEARVLARLDRAFVAIGDSATAQDYLDECERILSGLDLDEACLRLNAAWLPPDAG